MITDKYVDKGQIVYGELKKGEEAKKASDELKALKTDFSLLDDYVSRMVWTLTHTFSLNQMNTIDSIRVKKKFFWDNAKRSQIWGLGFGTNVEFYLGMNAFNTEKATGKRDIDFFEYRRQLAQIHPIDDELAEKVIAKPGEQKKGK